MRQLQPTRPATPAVNPEGLLVARAAAGDEAAFEAIMREHNQLLFRTARSILKNDQEAEDAVQDALIISWEKRHTLRQPQYFGTWLTRILINCAKQRLRAQRPNHELADTYPAPQEDTVENLALKMALENLPLKDRIPLILFHLDGYSVKEVSNILHLPQGTLKSRLARARMKLKEALKVEEVLVHAQN